MEARSVRCLVYVYLCLLGNVVIIMNRQHWGIGGGMEEFVGNGIQIFSDSQTGKARHGYLPSMANHTTLLGRGSFQQVVLSLTRAYQKRSASPCQGIEVAIDGEIGQRNNAASI